MIRHRIWAAPVALALLLQGCGLWSSRSAAPPASEDSPTHRACREEAQTDPAVRALDRQLNPDGTNAARLAEDRRVAITRAYRECLRRAGLALPGGVEPIRTR